MQLTSDIRTVYSEYVQSGLWRIHRNRALWLAFYQCSRCGGARDLEVHHKTYERLGHEWDQDLEVLCGSCHHDEHLEQAKTSPISVYVRLVLEVFGEEPFDSISSLSAEVKSRCLALKMSNDEHQIDKAINLVMGRLEFRRDSRPKVVQKERPWQSGPPCRCRECQDAGVSTRHIHRDVETGRWMHGEPLRRWYEARDAFRAAARVAVGRPGRHGEGFEPLANKV